MRRPSIRLAFAVSLLAAYYLMLFDTAAPAATPIIEEATRRDIEASAAGFSAGEYATALEPTKRLTERLPTQAIYFDRLARIRFASPHPRHVTPRMIDAMRTLPAVCRHLHLPVQSGSSRVLQAMRRRHTREYYLDLVARIRDAMPDIALSTDMIVGFPGETDEDFEATLSLTRLVRYHSMFSFKYSPRPNTLAIKRLPDDVDEREKTQRIVALQELQKAIQTELHEQAIGRVFEVLVDSRSRRRAWELSGRTSGNTVVNFGGDPACIGRLWFVVEVKGKPAGISRRWEAVNALEADHAFLLRGEVFTADLIQTWVECKRTKELDPIRLRPHPHEFYLYYDN